MPVDYFSYWRPAGGDAEQMREVELSDVAGLLRFGSKRDRLDVSEGRSDASSYGAFAPGERD